MSLTGGGGVCPLELELKEEQKVSEEEKWKVWEVKEWRM